MKKIFLSLYLSVISLAAVSADQFIVFKPATNHFPLITEGKPCPIRIDAGEDKGVKMAVENLIQDISNVCGIKPEMTTDINSKRQILIGTYQTPLIRQLLLSSGKLEKKRVGRQKRKIYSASSLRSLRRGGRSSCHRRERQAGNYLWNLRTV